MAGQHPVREKKIMMAGITLEHLSETILQQRPLKRDFVAPTRQLTLVTPNQTPSLAFNVDNRDHLAELTPLALRQIGAWAGIPVKYLDLISQGEHLDLLSTNVNHWLQHSEKKRLVRMLQADKTTARAFLSERFCLTRDHYDLALHVIPRLRQAGMEVKSCQLTDKRLYIQAVDTRLMRRIQARVHDRVVDDTLYAGVVISNCEVGLGPTAIDPMVYRLLCTNGMIAGKGLRNYIVGASNIHRNHLGYNLSGGMDNPDAFEVFKRDTISATDEAFWLQVRDVLDAALSEAQFHAIVDRMQSAADTQLPIEPARIVEVTAQRLELSSDEAERLMRQLFTDGAGSLYDLMNGVTRIAQDSENYDRAVELERLGSDVLTFDPSIFAKN